VLPVLLIRTTAIRSLKGSDWDVPSENGFHVAMSDVFSVA
jgi:hypothetical protein